MRKPSNLLESANITKSLGQACKVLIFFLMVFTCFAQSTQKQQLPPRPSITGDNQDTIKINVELVVLHLSVQNSERVPVSGLGKEGFQVYEDGVLQQIESCSYGDIPVTVGLVIDNSGSMRPKRSEVITAGLAFARASNTKDQMFAISFNERVFFGLPASTAFTNSRDQLEMAMSQFSAQGMTALYDATFAGLEHLKKGDRDKKVLIVISDGGDNASRHSKDEVMNQAKQSETIIYTIGIFDNDDLDRNPRVLRQLAKATGGETFLPESIKQVVPICERIAHDIRNQYTLTYAPTNINYDGKYRAIEVKARTPERERLVVRTRAGYYAQLKQ